MKEATKRWFDGVRARFCPTPSRKRLLRLVKDIKRQLAFERDGWVFGVPYLDHENDWIMVGKGFRFVVDSQTIGEYASVKDRNRKKIFEGDIVKSRTLFDGQGFGVVSFKDGSFGIKWSKKGVKQFYPFPTCNRDYEGVGNIYDNPELLEEMR